MRIAEGHGLRWVSEFLASVLPQPGTLHTLVGSAPPNGCYRVRRPRRFPVWPVYGRVVAVRNGRDGTRFPDKSLG
jgi:hypothetical protein